MMNSILTIINFVKKNMPKDLPKPLGRWRIENCNKQMNHKVDLSNEDHCGPCGQYALSKKKELKSNILDKTNENNVK